MREPGVIVYVSGEELPPPLPSTAEGIGFYVFARRGPLKPRLINVRNYDATYIGVDNMVDAQIDFILPNSNIYGMLLPNHGLYPAVGWMAMDPSNTANNITNLFNATTLEVLPIYRPIFYLPTWLYGQPKTIIVASIPVNTSLPNLVGIYNISITINSNTISRSCYHIYKSLPNLNPTLADIDTAYADLSVTAGNNITSDSQYLRAAYVNVGDSFLLWLAGDGNIADNIVIYKTRDTVTSQAIFFIYLDKSLSSLTALNVNITGLTGTTTVNSYSNYFLFNQSNVVGSLLNYSATYFYPVIDNVTLELNNPTAGSYELEIQQGSSTTTYPISYSPIDTGYYGFLDENRIEILTHGDIYGDLVSNPSTTIYYNSQHDNFLTSTIYFYHISHEGGFTRNEAADLYNVTFPSTPAVYAIAGYNTGSGPVYTLVPTPAPFNVLLDYWYVNGVFTAYNSENIYNSWLNAWHDAILYRSNDVLPMKSLPVEIDYLPDYSAFITPGFSAFIREHGKFIFKITGAPNLSTIPLDDRDDFVDQYYKMYDLLGYHCIRLQGNSLTGITATTLYIRAVIDYSYAPIFGLNASLLLTEADHEFRLNFREAFLDKNINCIVRDRTLNLWYFNNNLTEENRRDESPLGEDNNARAAIKLAKILGIFVERYIGEPNNLVTRRRVVDEVSSFIRDFINSRNTNLVDYRVICDETNNTPADIANNRLNIRVEVKFAKSIKYIVIFERVLMST
jgi:hypothetical protein